MTLGQRIQQIRLAHSLSQEAFGEKLNTTRQTVSRWELDQTLPELDKLVLLCRLFSVSADSLLLDGITTFDPPDVSYPCGVWRGFRTELVETEKFALLLSQSADGSRLTAALYRGYEAKKALCALCEYTAADSAAARSAYAYRTEDGCVAASDEALSARLGEAYDPALRQSMRRLERFAVDHSGASLPTVRQGGIAGCLDRWRRTSCYRADPQELVFSLSTARIDYVFSVQPAQDNVYCAATRSAVFELGLFSGKQYFRIRHYQNDTEPFCRSGCDFSDDPPADLPIPTDLCTTGAAVRTANGHLFCVKRYTDDEIILQGCGSDEYPYRRTTPFHERLTDE